MNALLEKIKTQKGLNWGELAELIGVSRSMLDQVRKGTRQFGPKVVRTLYELGREVDGGHSDLDFPHNPAAGCNACAGLFLETIERIMLAQKTAYEAQTTELNRLREDLKKLVE